MSGLAGEQCISNGNQEKIDQNKISYLLIDFSRIPKNISWIHLNISQISKKSDQIVKKRRKLEDPFLKI